MRFLLIPDKFKDSLSAKEVITVMYNTIKSILPKADIKSITLSDGGDGFLEALTNNNPNIAIKAFNTVNALNRPIKSFIGLDQISNSAFIELAQSSGIAQLNQADRNALYTSTYGTGLLIKNAISLGYNKIYLGLGGSVTNDGGCGLAAAFGYKFINSEGREFIPTAINLKDIVDIGILEDMDETIEIIAINDVTNPLLGKEGATYIYGPQKGLNEQNLDMVESGMKNLENVVRKKLDKNFAQINGAGAAGGTAYGLKVFFNAQFISGIEFFLENNTLLNELNFNKLDLIITGEGRIDDQTKYGKLISGVSNLGLRKSVPVVAFCGKNDLNQVDKEDLHLKEIIEISDRNKSLNYNLKHASKLLSKEVLKYLTQWSSNNKIQ